jgi:hypothetical protein
MRATRQGGFDNDGGPNGCASIRSSSFVSSGMQTFFDGNEEWKDLVRYDGMLYQAVNQCLDLTIDRLGRTDFEAKLAMFRHFRDAAVALCLPKTAFPCDLAGEYHRPAETVCLFCQRFEMYFFWYGLASKGCTKGLL